MTSINCYFADPYSLSLVQNLHDKYCLGSYKDMEKTVKSEQAELIYSLLIGKDVIGILTTGFGKTLIQVVPSMIVSGIKKKASITLFVSPVKSRITSMIEKLKYFNAPMMHCQSGSDFEKISLVSGKAFYLLVSQEVLTNILAFNWLERNTDKVDFICVDLVSGWDQDFRKEYYNELYKIRAFTRAPVALFASTVTKEKLEDMKQFIAIRESLKVITMLPRREEIFLNLLPATNSFDCLEFIVDEIKEKGSETGKTMIFVKTEDECTNLFIHFLEKLGDKCFNYNDRNEKTGYRINFCSSASEERTKTSILSKFQSADCPIRIAIFTVSYGMGLDFEAVKNVVMYGLGLTYTQLWQCIGRAGRNNQKANAFLIPISTSGPGVEVKIPGDVCVRKHILQNFYHLEGELKAQKISYDYDCCSYCRLRLNTEESKPN